MTENIGDGFAYHVLPAKTVNDIPRYCNPVVLVHCVDRFWELSSSEAPRCSQYADRFKFTNANNDELFADIKGDTKLADQELVDEELSRAASVTNPLS